jgi:hypothetical protein
MASNDIKDIKNFIAKYKHATDLNQPYLEFNLNWLNSFNKNLSNNVLYEFDCVRECEMSKGVLRNFITSLEVMLLETY